MGRQFELTNNDLNTLIEKIDWINKGVKKKSKPIIYFELDVKNILKYTIIRPSNRNVLMHTMITPIDGKIISDNFNDSRLKSPFLG